MSLRHSMIVCAVLAFALPAHAREDAKARDARFTAELEKLNPAAVPAFQRGNDALDKNDYVAAVAAFGEVEQLAPSFGPAERRHAVALAGTGKFDDALAEIASAGPSEDLVAVDLARARIYEMKGDLEKAESALIEARGKDDDDPDVEALKCQLNIPRKKYEALASCGETIATRYPDHLPSVYVGVLAALIRGDSELAETRLEQARALGLPAKTYDSLHANIEENKPIWSRCGPTFLVALGLWALAFVLLTFSGTLLSRLTLTAATRLPTEKSGRAQGGSALLRRAYGVVIFGSALFYYVSLPLLLATVLLVGGGLIYGCFAIGHVPIKLVFIVFILTVVTCWSVVKSVFVRRRNEDPGTRLDEAEAPKLRELLNEVAEKIGTRPVDTVYVTPGTELAVLERGSLRQRLQGRTERCLVLGVGVLEGLSKAELRSVLAHEYGHFTNADTAGGGLALSVRASMLEMARSLAQNGAAAWYNPAWLFFQGYFRVFLRISQGATRLQEVLADRWAAFAYGSESFAAGLTQVIRRSIRFDHHAGATLKEVVSGPRRLANLYAHVPAAPVPEEKLDRALREVLERAPSPYDSHPRPSDRIAWVRALGVSSPEDDASTTAAWALFADRARLEWRMTNEVCTNIAAQHGVRIVVEPAA